MTKINQINVKGVNYEVGGSQVAVTDGTSGTDLKGLNIDGTEYKIPSGGGGGTKLYKHTIKTNSHTFIFISTTGKDFSSYAIDGATLVIELQNLFDISILAKMEDGSIIISLKVKPSVQGSIKYYDYKTNGIVNIDFDGLSDYSVVDTIKPL